MKILLVHDIKPESLNGVSVSVMTLATNFKAMGHDVRFLTLNESIKSNKYEDSSYRIGSLPTGVYPGIRWTVNHWSEAFEEIIDWCPDVIHTNCEFSTFYMIFRILKNCKVRPKWIHTFHTDYRYYVGPLTKVKPFTNNILPKYLHWTFAKPNKIIVPSPKTKKYLLESRIVENENNIAVVPCGISVSIDDVDNELLKQLKIKHGLEGKKVIISLGRLSKEKNIDELMQYFASFSKKHDEYRLLICGVGPWLNHLKLKASALGIASKTVFCVNIPHKEVPTYMRLSDVFASSSMSETQGMTYYEAMISGVPVVATDEECLCDVLKPGVNGCFYNSQESFENAVLSCEGLKKGSSILGFDCSGKAFSKRVLDLYRSINN